MSTPRIPQRSEFLNSPPPERPLRITCYGSSSSDTPASYLQAAYSLGYIIAQRGHTCVNGAGSYGCMAAMNDGASQGGGHIVGVIHEMWLNTKDASSPPLRDGGAHTVFTSTENAGGGAVDKNATKSSEQKKADAAKQSKREMIVVSGDDLQERKKLLVKDSDGLVVLPGGPGTWDELWEMVCAKGIGLGANLPIVCVNCDNYYDPFHEMLMRAYEEGLTKFEPHELVHFVDTAEEAVQWLELPHEGRRTSTKPFMVGNSSFLHGPLGIFGARAKGNRRRGSNLLEVGLVFLVGVGFGAVITATRSKR